MRTLLPTCISAVFLCILAFSSISTPAFAATTHADTPNVSAQISAGCPATLSNGSSGSLVKTLQNQLNWNFYYGLYSESPYNFSPYLHLDGLYGPLTTNAVKDFQSAEGLAVDGIVGPQTWQALGYCKGAILV